MLSYPDVRDEHYHEDNHDGATEDYQRPTARPTAILQQARDRHAR